MWRSAEDFNVMCSLAFFLYEQEIHREAQRLQAHGLESARTFLGDEHAQTMESMEALTKAFEVQQKYGEAEELCRHVLILKKKVYADAHWKPVKCTQKLVRVLDNMHKYGESEELRRDLICLQIEDDVKRISRLGRPYMTLQGRSRTVANTVRLRLLWAVFDLGEGVYDGQFGRRVVFWLERRSGTKETTIRMMDSVEHYQGCFKAEYRDTGS
jgi:hypothetical protein